MIRIGNAGDGGYVIPARSLNAVEHLVSIGISDDWNFEEEAARRSPAIRIDGYDRTSGSLVWSKRFGLINAGEEPQKVFSSDFKMAKTLIQI